ncbi:lipopolysaccharide biosynthesis protein [Nocardioides jejuensis]|uniref:Lipopolysaccharide biosynthesis protein n=1 Tax=Nocardioides jejuensis TaxID=2502782 RepID=A0A4R1CKZ4_9ACTN|nr:hypothetical protein [Nocardioides jejuensis]TCJ30886.1 hypothetical protein EPD65_02285 [Nocardioides jejuensis]
MGAAGTSERTTRDPVTADALLMTALTVALAGFGGLFWVIAGHLQNTHEVGVAGTLFSSIMVLCFAAQFGVDRTLLAAMPHSDRPGSDFLLAVLTSGTAGCVLGTAFGLVLPHVAPATGPALAGAHPFVFGVLVAGAAVNLTTDAAFLSMRRVIDNFVITGIGMGLLKCGLPFLLAGSGAFGLVASVGLSTVIAALCCVVVIMRRLPRPQPLRHSALFRSELRLGASAWLANMVDFVPMLLLPVILVNAAGAAQNAIFFIGFQIVLMLNASAYVIGNAAFAEASRRPERAEEVIRHSAKVMAVVIGAGTVAVIVLARLLLLVFGSAYADQGVPTLRLLALGSVAMATAFWAITALRIRRRLRASVAVAIVSAGSATGLAFLLAGGGADATAVAWLAGHSSGALVGLFLATSRKGRA